MLFGYIWKYGLFGYGLGGVLCVLHGDALILVSVRSGCARSPETGSGQRLAFMRIIPNTHDPGVDAHIQD